MEGRERLYAYCRERGVPHKRLGKLLVATEEDEVRCRLHCLHLSALPTALLHMRLGKLWLRARTLRSAAVHWLDGPWFWCCHASAWAATWGHQGG